MRLAVRDALVIARREFLERVQTKWFVIVTLLGPVFMVAMIVIPAIIGGRGAAGAKVAIIDHTGILATPIAAELKELKWRPEILPEATTEDALKARIRDKDLNGYLILPSDALDKGTSIYRGDNASNQVVGAQLQARLTNVVIAARAARSHVDEALLHTILAKVELVAEHTNGETAGSSGTAAFLIGYFLGVILYMVITLYGVAVMRSVVVEKTSRVMELMVAAVKPSSLMAGKILGVGAAGLVQVAIWLAMGGLLIAYPHVVLGTLGIKSGATSSLPPLAFAEYTVIVLFFVLGYFFYAAMYAAVGAMVSSEQETQQVQLPVTMLLVVGLTTMQLVSSDPRGTAAIAMTLVPFWSPILMPMRYVLGGAPLSQVLLSLGLLVATTYLLIRGAAKIYRVGILMYGKRPGIAEVLRWLRHK